MAKPSVDSSAINARRVESVKPPPWFPLEDEEFYENGLPRVERIRKFLKKGGKLAKKHVIHLVEKATEVMKEEPNLFYLSGSFKVVGDLHGQFYDLDYIIKQFYKPMSEEYKYQWVFLGDYVDRGAFGLEVTLLLFALKIKYPTQIYLLRGNHEMRTVTEKFNFKEECEVKFGVDTYDLIMNAFDALPLAAVLTTPTGSYLALHGGISSNLFCLDDISSVDRFCEPGKQGLLCDILWSDPMPEDTGVGLDEKDLKEWLDVEYFPNSTRGVGCFFGHKAISLFLSSNGLAGLIRGHELGQTGYIENWMCQKEKRKFPFVLTVFSAPNYCGWYNNDAIVLNLDSEGYSYHQFSETKAPYVLPASLNGFSYTLPWLCERTYSFVNIFFGMLIDQIEDKTRIESMKKCLNNLEKVETGLKEVGHANDVAVKLKGLVVSRRKMSSLIGKISDPHISFKDIDTKLERSPLANAAPFEIDTDVAIAHNDVMNHKTDTNWSIFILEEETKNHYRLKVHSSGIETSEMLQSLPVRERAFVFLRFKGGEVAALQTKFVLIFWVPEGISPIKRAEVPTLKGHIKGILTNFSFEIHATDKSDIDIQQLHKKAFSNPN
eukprot:TRINITY_DN2661_c0_g1_i1.p1 TRINITY_DN2661_c0_g1~~TRINITY_DN2661_c0_g1_i1.p1  ORF type:complete len:605 (+),score=105.52 TRINITY_DN2661_c0_g1_i1:93-1907(+)